MSSIRFFFSSANPKVFFDVSIKGQKSGRIVFELFQDVVPKTAENFKQICIGSKLSTTTSKAMTFKDS